MRNGSATRWHFHTLMKLWIIPSLLFFFTFQLAFLFAAGPNEVQIASYPEKVLLEYGVGLATETRLHYLQVIEGTTTETVGSRTTTTNLRTEMKYYYDIKKVVGTSTLEIFYSLIDGIISVNGVPTPIP